MIEGHDPSKQLLLEIMSGHGNSEEYREYYVCKFSAGQCTMSCPEPTDNFLALLLASRSNAEKTLRWD